MSLPAWCGTTSRQGRALPISTRRRSTSSDSLAGSVMLAGVAIHVDGRDPSNLAGFGTAKRFVGHDVIAQPVVVGEEPAAVMVAVDREDGELFSPDDQELLEALSHFAAIAVRTSRALGRERARAEALARLRQTQTDAEARRETLTRVVETQERERRRLAQDLHDRTAGGLTSVLFALRRLERELSDDEQRATLAEAREGVAAAIEDVRDLISDLRPKVARRFRPRRSARAAVRDDRTPQRSHDHAGARRRPRPVVG